MKLNPILLEVFKNRFISISEEMGVTLNRTAFSPNIKERRDFSCALFDENGDMIAQAAHIPVHLGSMPMSVKSAIENVNLKDGDMVILNDPYKGGTHLPDVTIVAPVFLGEDKPQFFVANRAHHADIGGMTAGSMPLSTSIFQEGLIIPPLKIVEKGEVVEPLMKFLLNNVRTPYEREGDFTAQIMANITGIKRIEELVNSYGLQMVKEYAKGMMDYSEKILKNRIKIIPDGVYKFEDFMDDDGIEKEKIKIAVKLIVDNDKVVVDFTESDDQVKGSINAVYSITLSAVLYVFRSLIKDDIPTNAGLLRPIKLKTRKGSIVDAKFPASVAGGNVETSQRIVDVLLGALSRALPNEIPAASQGTMNNITIGGIDEKSGQPFTYYETIGGGMGASSFANGESAVHSHMTNTLNTPIEALEFTYPMMVEEYSIRKNSGGQGKYRGGDGIIRQIRLLNDAEVTMLTERRIFSPYGLNGGEPGKCGANIVISNGEKREIPGKFNINLKKGDIIRIETPGGGGFGKSK
ncbi:N-methylhydantoinase B [Deferribacter desulfuricans SSM1]|uniref:N-methylhydantoinase B n=1 Tax=Deferribacter desulfuricans (strain DSM 14783 / JCM 11476 / NBRC 101012 / SSM1) TaxID=639282 RepID=D3PCC4_DEFDS|nr:hydantoinase B/oxoprolinase family protein [Deferribacter desulfuricans]BAI80247.1 N-methylhydantoinase B [Deferribacter desulfuricans SSM1]